MCWNSPATPKLLIYLTSERPVIWLIQWRLSMQESNNNTYWYTGIIFGIGSVNERRGYNTYMFFMGCHDIMTGQNTGNLRLLSSYSPGPCITNVFATRRKNFSQWHRSFQRKLLSHWLKFLRHVAITLVIQGPGHSCRAVIILLLHEMFMERHQTELIN